MGGFSNFAISFTIISILAGCLTSYAIAFNQGGPVAITWGWLIVGLFCTIVALAMGEIASTYPTAGGLYYWASKLGTPGWGWFTGWFNLIGQIAVTASIGYGCAFFSTALLNLLFNYPNSFGWIFFLYGLILLGAGLVNMFKVPITAALNSFSAWWHMVGVLVIVGILIAVPDHHRSVGYVFGQTINNSGFSGSSWTHGVFIYVFLTGLLMAQYTITGYDASAHLSEETRRASMGAARVEEVPPAGLHGLGDLRARLPARDPDALLGLHRLRRVDLGRRDRALHRVRPADHPPPPRRRAVRARRVAPRAPLQVDRHA